MAERAREPSRGPSCSLRQRSGRASTFSLSPSTGLNVVVLRRSLTPRSPRRCSRAMSRLSTLMSSWCSIGIMRSIPVAAGLPETGILIVNTKVCSAEIKKLAQFNGTLYGVDATGISLELLGMDTPNVPMLGALVKLTSVVKMESLEAVLREHFLPKIGEEKVQKNISMLRKGYEEVFK